MSVKLNQVVRDESGLSALETAIVLIAFVVVASVFAFTMLSAGCSRRSAASRLTLASKKFVARWNCAAASSPGPRARPSTRSSPR